MWRLQGIDHLVLRVRSLPDMRAFYCDVLGCTVERVLPGMGLTQLRAGSALIDLVPVDGPLGMQGGRAPGPEGHNLDHFCLRLAPFDAEAIRQHLASHGVSCSEVQARYGAQGTGPSLYVDDPEGNTIELKGPVVQPNPAFEG